MEERVFGRRYRAIERIGGGGMAEVFKAVDDVLGRTVAVKVLHPHFACDSNFVARFRQEAQAAANLSHPNVVSIYDWGQDDSTYYIVMEYVRGTDLKTLVQNEGPLDPMLAAEYAKQVCSALSSAHGYGIIHRDVKPHNLVLTPDGTIKVMDFGIARAGNMTMTQTGSVLGTAQYLSPEQAQGRPLTPASDLYSLGVALYELTTGEVPFDADTPVAVALKQVNEVPTPPRQLRPSMPPPLEAVILKALMKDPAARYQSAEEMRADLDRVISGRPVTAAPLMGDTAVMPAVRTAEERTRERRPPAKRRGGGWGWLVLAAVAAVAAVLGWLLFGAPRTATVPDVRGDTVASATARLAEKGLVRGDITEQASDQVDPGLVISQSPDPGVKVDKGQKVDLVISKGIEQVLVPDLQGLALEDAVRELREAGLAVDIKREKSNEFDEGEVIGQTPAARTEAPKGSPVTIVVSQGPDQVKVPLVRGKTADEARDVLQRAGLTVTTSEEPHPTIERGRVISQSPSAGQMAEFGSQVTLVVSTGPEMVIVPEVIELTEPQARERLAAAGFQVKVNFQESPEDGIVLSQDPPPNAEAKKGSNVVIYVGRAPVAP